MKKIVFFLFILLIITFFSSTIYFSDFITNPENGYYPKFQNFFTFLPYGLLLLTIFAGAHFNRSKIVFGALFCIPVYNLILTKNFENTDFFIINLTLILFFTLLNFLNEKGILTLRGIIKIIFFGAYFYFALYLTGINRNNFDLFIQKTPYLFFESINHRYFFISLVLSLMLISAIYLFKNLKNKFSPFIFSLVIFLTLILFGRIYLKDISAVQLNFIFSSYFSFIALIFTGSLYFSTWERVFTDELTGLLNRRAMDEHLNKLGKTYTITMMDIDHFKKFNDTYGHQAGDDVLKHVSSILEKNSYGKTFRYGGEEFAVVTGGKTYESLVDKADFFRLNVEKTPYFLKRAKKKSQLGKKVFVTVSMGLASSTDFISDPADVLQCADGALYRAKNRGRNRVEVEKRKKKRK
ncbi:MAG: diguanylate cyclase [Candidatus Muiribacteriota bacterium]